MISFFTVNVTIIFNIRGFELAIDLGCKERGDII